MNKEQLEAIRKRIKQSKSSNWVSYMVINEDVPALIAEVEKLNLEFLLEYTKYDRMLERLYAKSGENERLREENKRLREALETIETDISLSHADIMRLAEKTLKGANDNE